MSNPILTKGCVEYVSAHYSSQSVDTTKSELERLFGVSASKHTIRRTARKLGLNAPRGGHRFQKGTVPKNHKPFPKGRENNYWTGKSRKELMQKESLEKSLSNLRAGHNVLPIGSIRTYEGDKFIKYRETVGGNKDGWMRLDRYVFQKAHGEVPDENVFIHLNGDKGDCSLDNLRCVDHATFTSLLRYKVLGKSADVIDAYIKIIEIEKGIKKEFNVKAIKDLPIGVLN